MAGPYCRYCDQRCFVERVWPPDEKRPYNSGRRSYFATCPAGAEHDRAVLGFDYRTAGNPRDYFQKEALDDR